MVCPKCGSQNVQVMNEVVGEKTRGRATGCLWKIGRWLLIICTCGLWLLVGRRKETHKTKTKNRTVAICQDCAYRWNP